MTSEHSSAALRALDGYDDDPVDLLADLMHLMHERGIDIDNSLRIARGHFDHELAAHQVEPDRLGNRRTKSPILSKMFVRMERQLAAKSTRIVSDGGQG